MKLAFVRTGLTLLAASMLLGGCLNLGDASKAPAVVYYVLRDTGPAAPVSAAVPLPVATLRVLDTTTGNFYDTEKLVFSRSPDTRGLYQYARWTERPGKRFTELMRARLERQGGWNVSGGASVPADWQLDTELVEFYHDATSEPGQVRLVLRAAVIDIRQRTVLGQRVFEQQVPLERYDAAAAAQASSLAVSRLLDELTPWLASLK
ncbi:MAG: hypothetical protein B7Z35_06815 [Hydrogenophilales bacterium 12-61-10]|nr:MAG: hypothetical protein B7Z35_06815 [Hydrogenophilales bacterium 12-61-10]OYX32084.1 MAG: hypothetical protein B7Z03_02840 [Hydrogenophilales bacterium 32-62-9]